ncbi:MAG: hypothetical protein IJ256_06345 [Bacteroidaceae bacterium]|nr:hypothetical protein [Bacteroidaceae bacterium]
MKKYVILFSMMAMMLSSCKGDDNKVFPVEPDITIPDDNKETDKPGISSFTANVGALLNDWVATRSDVAFDEEKGIYNLSFTEGDRLSIYGYFEDAGQKYAVRGLTKVKDIEEEGRLACFNGELYVNRMVENEGSSYGYDGCSYDFKSEDPLSECTSFTALIYPSEFTGGGNPIDGLFFEEARCIAPDVSTLIEKALPIVSQTYDKENHRFTDFKAVTPILDFNLDLLNSEYGYIARMFHADSQADFKEGKYEQFFITLNITGPFAFTLLNCYEYGVYDGYWVLQFDEQKSTDSNPNQFVFELGDIKFEPGKVYDLSKIIYLDN